MMDLLRPKLLLFVLILLFTIQSCAEMKSWIAPQSPANTKTSVHIKHKSKATGQAPNLARQNQVPSQAPVQASTLARQHMEAGEYQEAIEIYNDECRKQPKDLPLEKEYAKSLEGIKSNADKALEKRDFAYAGRMYYVLQNNYDEFNNVDHMLSFNSAYLNTKLSFCKKSLSMQGFKEYRKGNLNKAIVLWQSLLVIDPNNKDIKEAVRTATQQQKNLQVKK
jgi:tetratricopeptide (TPR) repeat protein